MEMTCKEMDDIIFYIAKTPRIRFEFKPENAAKVAACIDALRNYDTKHTYTTNDDCSMLWKEEKKTEK